MASPQDEYRAPAGGEDRVVTIFSEKVLSAEYTLPLAQTPLWA
jgi:hypothetical protein